MGSTMLRTIARRIVLGVTLLVLCGSGVYGAPITPEQLAFGNQLIVGNYLYPVLESGPLAGQPALFDDPAVAFASGDGFWRSLLKGAAVVAGGVTGAAVGTLVAPGGGTGAGGAIGAIATATVVNDINRQGPGPGRRWLISDARFYDRVEVAGIGNILPDVLSTAVSNVESTMALSPTLSLSFVDPSVIGVGVKDSSGNPISTVDHAQAFVLTSNIGPTPENFFGSMVLNTIGFPGSRPLTSIDFIDIDVGSLLFAPDGTSVLVRSTPIVGFTAVPEPSPVALFGIAALGLFGHRWLLRRRHGDSKTPC